MDVKLPDFICVGVQKSGTTWIYEQLDKHPDILMPEVKEIGNTATTGKKNFFGINDPFDNIIKYSNFFPKEKFTGDVTPLYFYDTQNAIKIKKNIPNAFVFVVLRNPAHRAYSQWRMMRQRNTISKDLSFLNCFFNNLRDIQKRGLYIKYIEPFMKIEKFKIYFYENLINDPSAFINQIVADMGLNACLKPSGWLEMPYHNDGKKISTGEYRECIRYYESYIKDLEFLLKTKTKWINYEKFL